MLTWRGERVKTVFNYVDLAFWNKFGAIRP